VNEGEIDQRVRDYARLLLSIADAASARLEEIRLPLHILLENRFGELNENQEEMLGAARAAAEAADADMVSLRQLAELELGVQSLRRDRIKPSELIESLRPMLLAAAAAHRVTLELEVAPLLPVLTGDRARLQEALATLLRGMGGTAPGERRVRIVVDRDEETIRVAIAGTTAEPASVRWMAAMRMIQAHGGAVAWHADDLSIELPVDGTR
jgi:K+-sensing histidine kinase KdpD